MASGRRPIRRGRVIVALLCCVLSLGGSGAWAQEPPAAGGESATAEPANRRFDADFLPMPPWAETQEANAADQSGPIQERNRAWNPARGALPSPLPGLSGPSSGLAVYLATGALAYLPQPDISVRNPQGGANATFQRCYRSEQAWFNYGSPGLSPGWAHSFDVILRPRGAENAWGVLQIVYPTRQPDHIKPVLDAQGSPTGEFQAASGAPFKAKGVPGEAAGTWKSITLQWAAGVEWEFRSFDKGLYALRRLDYMTFAWGKKRELLSVSEADTGKSLLTLAYDPMTSLLKSVADNTGRRVDYFFGPPSASETTPYLLYVSALYTPSSEPPPVRYAYGYTFHIKALLLSSIGVPGDKPGAYNAARIAYQDGRVSALIDANGNERQYLYKVGHTYVQLKEPGGKISPLFIQNLDTKGRNIGRTDAAGHSTEIRYSDSPKP